MRHHGVSRREFAKAAVAGLASIAIGTPALQAFGADQPDRFAPSWAASNKLKPLGTLKTRSAREIEASRIGIGMECLDRQMYLPEKTYGYLAALGAKWARLQTGWSRCERKEGVYDFAWLDEVVNNVIAAGVKPWFNVGYGNKLYSPDAPHESAVGQVPLYDGERGVNAWKRFLGELAGHFKDRIEHWEIWNEPNISCFWHPKHKSSPIEYTRLVAISAEAIHSKHPKAQIAACVSGIAPQFIEDCFKAGMGQHISIFAIHPYNIVPESNYAAMVGRVRASTRRFAPHVRLWQGECGVPSQAETQMSHGNMDELKQAKWLVRRLLLDVFMDLDLAQYFHLCDLMESNYRQADGKAQLPPMFGILNGKTYTPKLAYATMQSVATLFDADTHPEPGYYCALLPAASGTTLLEPYTMLFRRRGVPMLAYHQAANVLNDTPCVTVDVVLCCDSDPKKTAEVLREPVLVDPVRQAVYALPAPARNAVEGQFRPSLRFENLPCLDYPLLITDKCAIG